MMSLELKIPPPIVALIAAGAMWAVGHFTGHQEVPEPVRIFGAVTLVLVGSGMTLSGARAFRKVKTTINPLEPEKSSTFVNTGIYAVTRNPMYLGLLFVLAGWSLFLASPRSLLGLPSFVLYIGRFQIAPEERVLEKLFGAEYSAYKAKVRRWL
jgi:protein-S-isoprenylcysteine O-methyltransferase Ste14